MTLLRFSPLADKRPEVTAGLVLRATPKDHHYLRVTHVFPECVYYLVVTTAAAFRDCGKPQRLEWQDLDRLLQNEHAAWGHLQLPDVFACAPLAGSDREAKISKGWERIEPLVNDFDSEPILRKQYTRRLEAHANKIRLNWLTLRRLLNSYYYFGRCELALGGLARGPVATTAISKAGRTAKESIAQLDPDDTSMPTKRRAGRRSEETRSRGEHTVVLDAQDVKDMEDTLKKALTPPCQVKSWVAIAKEYRDTKFLARYPDAYTAWREEKKTANPVTTRLFRYRTRHVDLTEGQLASLTQPPVLAEIGHLRAKGPNEVCEADGSGGRLWLLASGGGPKTVLGKCNLYIFIDRWSRLVHGVHITLAGNSSAQLCKAMEYAFTKREARYARLGLAVTEDRWPRSHPPTELTTDRGPDFLSGQTVVNVVKHLRIKHTPLRAYFPDGKAIVERFIGTLKKRMSENLKGAFSRAIKDRDTKEASEWAKSAAVETLQDAYRVLIKIVMDYNNTPHSGLREMDFVKRHGIVPTPRNVYLEGMRLITGRRAPRLSDEQFAKMLLTDEKATLRNGVLRHRTYQYEPADALAMQEARDTPRIARSVKIKADADKINLYMIVGESRLAHFRATEKTLAFMGKSTVEEEDFRKPINSAIEASFVADAERDEATARLAARAVRKSHPVHPAHLVQPADEAQRRQLRRHEQDALERRLEGRPPAAPPAAPAEKDAEDGVNGDANVPEWLKRRRRMEAGKLQAFRERHLNARSDPHDPQ